MANGFAALAQLREIVKLHEPHDSLDFSAYFFYLILSGIADVHRELISDWYINIAPLMMRAECNIDAIWQRKANVMFGLCQRIKER